MSLDEDVEMLSARMGNLQCQEHDKKDVSSETIDKIKEDVGYQGPSMSPMGLGSKIRCEQSKEPLDEDDPKLIMKNVFSHMKALQTAMTFPLLQVVKTFDGHDGTKFKQWVKDIERYAQMARLNDGDIPTIVHIACTGPVADFVQRYLDEYQGTDATPSWKELKKLMTKRFAEISDSTHAMAVLRRVRQCPSESVQMYSERLLRIAEDTYPPSSQKDQSGRELVQKQLLDVFCDGLFHDYLRMKVMRTDPKTFEEAVEIAMKEQNLRKRFNLRSNSNYTPFLATNDNEIFKNSQNLANHAFQTMPENMAPAWPSWVPEMPSRETETRQIEPMEIDHFRNLKCFKCSGFGHRARNCPSKIDQNRLPVNAADDGTDNVDMTDGTQNQGPQKGRKPPGKRAYPDKRKQAAPKRPRVGQDRVAQGQVPPQVPEWIRGAECWICHMIGHLKRNCSNRVVPDRNRVPVFPQGNWNGPRPQEN